MRFLLIDKILAFEKGKRLLAIKNVSMSEDIFTDHFPTFPVMPGALIVDAFEQTAILCIEATLDFSGLVALRAIKEGKFRKFVRPGDQIVIEATITALDDNVVQTRCWGKVDAKEVARAELHFARLDAGQSQHPLRLKGLFQQLTSLS